MVGNMVWTKYRNTSSQRLIEMTGKSHCHHYPGLDSEKGSMFEKMMMDKWKQLWESTVD
jgi:hypothetical protein